MANNNSQKGLGAPLTISIIALAFMVAGVAYYAVQKQFREAAELQEKALMEKGAMEKKAGEAMVEKKLPDETMKKEGETMMKKEDGAMMVKYTGTVLAGKSAPLLDFTKADYDAVINSDKLVVLYFYANWCPICKAEFPVMQEAFNELSTDKVIGFRVNYNDDQTDNDEKNLAREFGVAYQHTKVLVKNGQRILKSPEGWDDRRYDMEINKALAQ